MEGIRVPIEFTNDEKERLEIGSDGDAHHDFGREAEYSKIRPGLPFKLPIHRINNESDFLDSILGREYTAAMIRSKHNGQVDLIHLEHGIGETEYTARCFHEGRAPSDTFDMTNQIYTVSQWRNFFGGNDTVYLLFDAANVSILDYLSSAEKDGNTLNVYVIINRENVNDCATKIYEAPKSKQNGVMIDFLYDAEKTSISYVHSEVGRMPLERSSFCSTYDILLGPLQRTGKLPTAELKLYDQQKRLLHHSNNPNTTNTITECLKRIAALFQVPDASKIAANFQCKRSGDWLQALSCLDMKRTYTDKAGIKVEINGPILLVSHDQILVWFSLYIGIPVVFTQLQPRTATNPVSKRYTTLYIPTKYVETNEARTRRLAAEAEQQSKLLEQTLDYIDTWYNENEMLMASYQTEMNRLYNAALADRPTLETCIKLSIQKEYILSRYKTFESLVNQKHESLNSTKLTNLYVELQTFTRRLVPTGEMDIEQKVKQDFIALVASTVTPMIPPLTLVVPSRVSRSGISPSVHCATIAEILLADSTIATAAVGTLSSFATGRDRQVGHVILELLRIGIPRIPTDLPLGANEIVSDVVSNIVVSVLDTTNTERLHDMKSEEKEVYGTLAASSETLLKAVGNTLLESIAATPSVGGGRRRRITRKKGRRLQQGGVIRDSSTLLLFLYLYEIYTIVEQVTTEDSFDTEYYEIFITFVLHLLLHLKQNPYHFVYTVLYAIPNLYSTMEHASTTLRLPFFLATQTALHVCGRMDGSLPRLPTPILPLDLQAIMGTFQGIDTTKQFVDRIHSYKNELKELVELYYPHPALKAKTPGVMYSPRGKAVASAKGRNALASAKGRNALASAKGRNALASAKGRNSIRKQLMKTRRRSSTAFRSIPNFNLNSDTNSNGNGNLTFVR